MIVESTIVQLQHQSPAFAKPLLAEVPLSGVPISEVYNMDCVALMKEYPDKWFDLAICDPPYGINRSGQTETFTKNAKHKRKHFENKGWDLSIPEMQYFTELFRVSKNQIVWGANHFISRMPKDSKCWIIWDKKNDGFSFADGEMAWTSFDTAVRFFRYHRGKQTDKRIHPTQKPKDLYRWLLKNYAKQGNKILDTHGGSMSIAIACDMEGFELDICEIDVEYFETGKKRYDEYKQQGVLF